MKNAMKPICLTGLSAAAFMLCVPGFSGAQISGTGHNDRAQIETAAISPALHHSEILQIQQCLHDKGIDSGIANALLGEKIKQALRQWQGQYSNTRTDALTDPDQQTTLINCLTPAQTEAMLTLASDEISLMQQCLHSTGFDPGIADGLFGPQTRQALRQWQASHEYPQTGYVADPDQRVLLISCLTPAQMEQITSTDKSTQLPANPQKTQSVAKKSRCQKIHRAAHQLHPEEDLNHRENRWRWGTHGAAVHRHRPHRRRCCFRGVARTPCHPIQPDLYQMHVVERSTGNIGLPMTATNPNGDTLTYSLSGPDAAAFTIHPQTAQLSVAPSTTLDSQAKSSYRFSIIATNPTGQTTTQNVLLTVVPTSLQRDWEALKALYSATSGPNWENKEGWAAGVAAPQVPTAEELNGWHGVTVTDNQVTALNLGLNNLIGSIPDELGNLAGLERLDLASNWLTGDIPAELGNLTNLIHLDLENRYPLQPDALGYVFGNQLTGAIPAELGNLTKLTTLALANNKLTGTIPTELGNLTNLTQLSLGENKLTGSIPTELGKLTKLTSLYLGNNDLTGTIPTELGKLTELTSLYLGNSFAFQTQYAVLSANQLTGAIPPELGNLTKLTSLYLANNNLTGTIPTELGNLTSLTSLNLSNNLLTGDIPTELGNLTRLEDL